MMRRTFSVGVVVGAMILGACSSSSDEPAPFAPSPDPTAKPDTAKPNALEAALQQGTGVPWAVDIDPASGLAAFAKPLGTLRIDAAPAAFLARFPAVFGVTAGELTALREETDPDDGSKVTVLEQRIEKLLVESTTLAVHLASDGTLTSIQGHGFRPATPATAARSEADARAAAAAASGSPADGSATLTYFPHPAAAPKSARLAYAVRVRQGLATGAVYFVDATDGSVLSVRNDLSAAEGSGVGASGYAHRFSVTQNGTPPAAVTYSLESPDRAYPSKVKVIDVSGGSIDGPAISSAKADEWVAGASEARRGQAVDAYGYAIAAVKYYSARFRQNSYDNANGKLDVLVHDSGDNYNAAGGFLDGGRPVMLFTDGVPSKSYKTLATAPDVVGHELGHLIQRVQTGKKGQDAAEGQSIEEGLADIMGMLFELSLAAGDPSTVGEAAFTGGVRNLKDPTQCTKSFGGPCPVDIDDPAMKSSDPHIPSTIVSHAFYMAAFGGENAKLKIAITDPISTAQAEDLYFETVKKCYQTGATYKALAQCQVERAKAKGIPFQPIACAWAAVKVVSVDDAKKRYNVSCDSSVSCEGKTNGYYCAPDVIARKATSYKCQGGKVASQDTCLSCVEYHNDRSKQNCSK